MTLFHTAPLGQFWCFTEVSLKCNKDFSWCTRCPVVNAVLYCCRLFSIRRGGWSCSLLINSQRRHAVFSLKAHGASHSGVSVLLSHYSMQRPSPTWTIALVQRLPIKKWSQSQVMTQWLSDSSVKFGNLKGTSLLQVVDLSGPSSQVIHGMSIKLINTMLSWLRRLLLNNA